MSDNAVSGFLKQHAKERAVRAKALDGKVERVLLAVDTLENDVRAAVGLQLNSVIANQQYLEASVRVLKQQVGVVSKRCVAWGGQVDALKASAAEIGGLQAYLEKCDATLARVNEHLEVAAVKTEAAAE